MTDLKFALRQLRKNPGFTAVAVLTLALGIGVTTAIFSVVNSVLLRPLPYGEPDRLVVLKENRLPGVADFAVAPGNYFSWKEQSTSFEHLAAEITGNFNWTGTDKSLRLNVRFLTANVLTTLRVHPSLGRDFRSEEETVGHDKVVLLSHGFWERHFGGARDVLNRTMVFNGDPFTVIGVLPASFRSDSKTDIYVPAVFNEQGRQNHGNHFLEVTGRLKVGVTAETAQRELDVISARLGKEFPVTNKGVGVQLIPVLESMVGSSRPLLFSLLGAVGFLLLIACANVASLQLTRATARRREMAVRTALGAGRIRITRQLLTENLMLSCAAGVLALFVARWGVEVLVVLAPENLPRAAEISVDGPAFALTCGLALITGIAFGLVPAFQAMRIDSSKTLKEGGRGASESGHTRRLRGALITVEVAVALMLLVGAGLLGRSFVRLQQVQPGFQPENAVAVTLSLAANRYDQSTEKSEFAGRVLEQLRSINGVQHSGLSAILPFSGDDFNLAFNIAGRPPLAHGVRQSTLYYSISPDYFHAMGIPLLRGRFFDFHDIAGSPRVCIINESLAESYFPGQDPIGQRINLSNGPESFREIVGIVGNVKHYRVDDDPDLQVQTYEPFAQQPYDFMTFVIRTAGPVPGLSPAIQSAVAAVDKDQPIASVRPLSDLVAVSYARHRFAMMLFAVFSGAALLLSVMGIYGVMAYSVARRTGEIGVRMALGAQKRDVFRLVLRQGGQLIVIGTLGGLIGSLLLTRFIAGMLYHVTAHDPLTIGLVTLLLATVAALACLIPARRAANIDPMEALRNE